MLPYWTPSLPLVLTAAHERSWRIVRREPPRANGNSPPESFPACARILAPLSPHMPIGGFNIGRETLGIHQRRFKHALAQSLPQLLEALQVARQLGRNVDVLLGVLGGKLRQADV